MGSSGWLIWSAVAWMSLHAGWQSQVAAAELRDPFLFGPRAQQGTEPLGPILVGVFWDATQPLAMVGEEAVAVGGRVGGWQIVRIQPDGILIQRGDRREFLTTGSPFPAD